ncbi:SDR family NAD(P)-dependent oxidoreductase [Leptospira koniambonensis]|uniref:SDR family NAD(P)-dependent oxidoreductase n=1 Tax=Leptospira koniambonensis TaxID=2484950 RepID=UPI003EBDD2BC
MSKENRPVVFLTGAAGGIGRETAALLSKKGYLLFLTDLQKQSSDLKKFAETLGKDHVTFTCDISKAADSEKAINECIKQFGKIDVLVNNAGIMRPSKFENLSQEEIDEQIGINVIGTIRLTKLGMPHLKNSKGKLVILSSLAGIVPAPHHSIYSATKFALRGFALSLYLEWKEIGIRVSSILPGTIQSPMTKYMASRDSSPMAYINPPLPPSAVAKSIWKAIQTDKAEIYVPYSQGLLARVALLFPSLLSLIYPIMAKKGIRNFESWKRKGVFD